MMTSTSPTTVTTAAAAAAGVRTHAAPAAPVPTAPASTVAIDPIKLILRHKWLLLGSLVGGLIIGTILHVAFLLVYPIWRPTALFVCNQPEANAYQLTGASGVVNQDEQQMFMQTQVRLMLSDEVLDRVATDARLENEAKNWIEGFRSSDGKVDTNEVFKELQKEVRARAVPQTSIIELYFGWKKKEDAAAIVKLVQEQYMDLIRKNSKTQFDVRLDELRKSIDASTNELTNLNNRRVTLINQYNIDTNNPQFSEAVHRLDNINKQQIETRSKIEDLRTQLATREEQLNDPSGVIKYSKQIDTKVDSRMEIININEKIVTAESDLNAIALKGIKPEHRDYKQKQSLLDALRDKLQVTRKNLMDQEFRSELEQIRQELEGYQAQDQMLQKDREEQVKKQVDLTRALSEIEDIDARTRALTADKGSAEGRLKELVVVTRLPTALRVVALQSTIRLPKEPAFPRLVIMMPAGAVLGLALVGSFIVLREIVDQRIKGPSDIALLPRTRTLGWVADAAEDPAGSGVVETAFRDRPRGIVAENFRQLRSVILKRMETAGHKTIVVVGCMPGSGSTTMVSNLALACAASDLKVLVIDANFRRPAMHKVFGLAEGPGLGDVLAGVRGFADAVQVASDGKVRVMTAGSRDKRMYEQIATEAFAGVIREARSRYDVVLIDVPPAVVCSDGVAVANRCEASMLIARAFNEKRGMVARIKNELSEAKGEFLGVVVNGVKSSAGGYLKGNIKATAEYHADQTDQAA